MVNHDFARELELHKNENQYPSHYKVIMHGDDYTPLEFVLDILERFFFMDTRRAMEVIVEVHIKGKAQCGTYTKEIAETKVSQVVTHARRHEHPLICSMEVAI